MGGTATPSGTTVTTSSFSVPCEELVLFLVRRVDFFLIDFLEGVILARLVEYASESDARASEKSVSVSVSVGMGLYSPSLHPSRVALRFLTILWSVGVAFAVSLCDGDASEALYDGLVVGVGGRFVDSEGSGGTGFGLCGPRASVSSLRASWSLCSRSETRLLSFFCLWRSRLEGVL
jgi:hypothetical protein